MEKKLTRCILLIVAIHYICMFLLGVGVHFVFTIALQILCGIFVLYRFGLKKV